MLKYRAISFPLLLGLLWAIFFSPFEVGVWVFAVCATATIGLAAYECARMIDAGLVPSFPKTTGLLAAAFVAVTLAGSGSCDRHGVFGRLWMLLLIACALVPWAAALFGSAESAKKGFATVAAVWATIVPFGMVAALYFPDPKYLFFVILVTKAMDTGGYVFGMLSGKWLPGGNHKLCPSISPKKSWEGFAGGMLLSLLVAWALYAAYPEWDFSLRLGVRALWKYLAFGALLALASIAGDLTESALKRKCGVKDSGNLIPGMGGPLDVLDSFIYVGPACMIYSLALKAFNL